MISPKVYVFALTAITLLGSVGILYLHRSAVSRPAATDAPAPQSSLFGLSPLISFLKIPAAAGSPAVPVPQKKLVPPSNLTEFFDGFSGVGTIREAGNEDESSSLYWWVNSGGYFLVKNGTAETYHGALPPGARFYVRDAVFGLDTDQGARPQNLFRLVTRTKWKNLDESLYFKIDSLDLNQSPNRNESNGVLLFSRYVDENNLYYMGLRVDGAAVIKKKSNGVYHELAYGQVYPGVYDKNLSPNLLPLHKWIGIRSVVRNNSDGSVDLQLYIDKDRSGDWTLLLEAKDTGAQGGHALAAKASAGIRTDFMDASFDQYAVKEVK